MQSSRKRTYEATRSRGSYTQGDVRVSSAGGSTVIDHEETVEMVASASGALVVTDFSINPINVSLFGWLANIAHSFQQYRWRKLEFVFLSTCGDSLAADVAAMGLVCLAVDYNSGHYAEPLNISDLEILDGAVSARPSKTFSLRCKTKSPQLPLEWFDVANNAASNDGGSASASDVRFTSIGDLFLGVQGQKTAGIIIGQLRVRYVIELQKPIAARMNLNAGFGGGDISMNSPDVSRLVAGASPNQLLAQYANPPIGGVDLGPGYYYSHVPDGSGVFTEGITSLQPLGTFAADLGSTFYKNYTANPSLAVSAGATGLDTVVIPALINAATLLFKDVIQIIITWVGGNDTNNSSPGPTDKPTCVNATCQTFEFYQIPNPNQGGTHPPYAVAPLGGNDPALSSIKTFVSASVPFVATNGSTVMVFNMRRVDPTLPMSMTLPHTLFLPAYQGKYPGDTSATDKYAYVEINRVDHTLNPQLNYGGGLLPAPSLV